MMIHVLLVLQKSAYETPWISYQNLLKKGHLPETASTIAPVETIDK